MHGYERSQWRSQVTSKGRRGEILRSRFDPITLEILWRRLVSIVDEADASVARTAFSSLLRDAHDYTCMFTDRHGRELAQGTFCHAGPVRRHGPRDEEARATSMPLDDYRPGDVFIIERPLGCWPGTSTTSAS
ncbi:MAG: hydantoinase B/oxoprolinase family protein [Comamonadaceae bacterium]|nr:hydantoinase B/oxoprolinase family protein [Comamonadaceae bacterium]